MSSTTTSRYIGQSLKRREDYKLLVGSGEYVADMVRSGMLFLVIVRSELPHAHIKAIDLSHALAHPRVVAAFAGTDLDGQWTTGLPCAWPVTEDMKEPDHWPLARGKVRCVGDAVAVVVAETLTAAVDAAELIVVEYENLPAVTDIADALLPDAPLVHEEYGTNKCYEWTLCNGPVDELFASSPVVVESRLRQQRIIPTALEPRGVLVEPAGSRDAFTVYSATQVPHLLRTALAAMFELPESALRVVAPDVGGGFGAKLNVYAEEAISLAVARVLRRPVKWVQTRSDDFVATTHARDVLQEIQLAATSEGKIRAVRARLWAAMGAHLQLFTSGVPLCGAWLYAGCYDVEAYDFACVGVFTNTTPTDAYRGAGRPEATYAIERAIDDLARHLALDPAEVRRRNFIRDFPADIASGLTIDTGDFDAALTRALEMVNYPAVRTQQRDRRARNDRYQLGIGLSSYLEMAGFAPSRTFGALKIRQGGWEAATVSVLPDGTARVLTGTSPHGQGHETTFAQIVADELGIPPDYVEVLHSDTNLVPFGLDTYGSRSLAVGGIAITHATREVLEKAARIAAEMIEIHEDDLIYSDGAFRARGGGGRVVSLNEVATEAWRGHQLPDGMQPSLEVTHVYDPVNFSWPAGTHVAVIELDRHTGLVNLRQYVAVDDVGTVINPMIVDGQIHGGLAQGIGQALYEGALYDEYGTLLTGSLLTYGIPSAPDLPAFAVDRTETKSPLNPLGVKGAAETGTVGSPAAVMNAVSDALTHLGVKCVDMPATPEKVLRALSEARLDGAA
jgi:aerobic carbon-monoxide dehydrogenase large subunit